MDIPQDIRETADGLACWESLYVTRFEAIAEALMAERARCLRIVEERCEGDMDFAAFLIKRTDTSQK